MSYLRKNEGAIVFAVAIFAFLATYFIRRCRQRAIADTMENELISPRRPHRGLDTEVIKSFPSFIYTKEGNEIKLGQGELECVVCLNEYKDDETLRLLSPCEHVFHVDCVDIWLSYRSTCPICRADVVP